jgi:hypothetical protein
MSLDSGMQEHDRNGNVRFYSACIVRCIGLCHYYQGEHNNSDKPEKREKSKD